MKKSQIVILWATCGTIITIIVLVAVFVNYRFIKKISTKMTTSIFGKNFIKKTETLQLTAYPDGNSYSIGYGHNGVEKGATITKEEAERLFDSDIVKFEKPVQELAVKLTQNQFDALVSFCYNIGINAFKSSTLYKKVKENPTDKSIKEEFMKWVNEKGVQSKGLIARRQKESDLYFS